jgi:hypothetical protein
MRDRFTQAPPLLMDGYQVLARIHADGLRAAFPTVAPELIAAIAANVIGKVGGLAVGDPHHGLPAMGYDNGSNVLMLAALRLWESGS